MRDDTSKGMLGARPTMGGELGEVGLPLEELVRRGAHDNLLAP